MVEDQQSLIDELREAVVQWQDLQAASALGRVECQLSELRDLVANNLIHTQAPAGEIGAAPGIFSPAPPAAWSSAPGRLEDRHPPAAEPPQAGSWEARKAAMLAGDDAEPAATSCTPLAAIEFAPTEVEVLSAAPAGFEVALASLDELREAVVERDLHIQQLTERLHAFQSVPVPPIHLPSMEGLPDEQRRYLQAWEAQLQDRLRKAEVELSMERARLARDEIALRHQCEQLNKDRRKRAGDAQDSVDDEAEAAAQNPRGSVSNRRWLSFFKSKPTDGTK